MSWKKACFIYCLALGVTIVANIEKVSVWTDDHFAETPLASVSRQARRLRDVWRESALGIWSKNIDCAVAPYFDETYKNSFACRKSATPDAAERALRARLDPTHPVLKPDASMDTVSLLASLTQPEPQQPAACPALQTALSAGMPATANPPSVGEQATPQPTLTTAKRPALHKLLVVGDSLAIGLSLSLRRCVATLDGVQLIEEGKVSSGLANPRYYDWGKALGVFLDKYKPDLVVIMMGANDARYINLHAKPRPAGSTNKSWAEVFAMRIRNFLTTLTDKHVPSYWIGLPIMGDPTYAKQAQVMNDILRAECAKAPQSHFLETWNLLADDQGKYSTFLPNGNGVKIKVRANDKIHFTVAGGDILAQFFLKALAKDVTLRPRPPREPAGQTNAAASTTP